jgi:hypothetical protein
MLHYVAVFSDLLGVSRRRVEQLSAAQLAGIPGLFDRCTSTAPPDTHPLLAEATLTWAEW